MGITSPVSLVSRLVYAVSAPNLLVVPQAQRRTGRPVSVGTSSRVGILVLIALTIRVQLFPWLLLAGGQTSRQRGEEYGQGEVAQGDW